MSYNHISVSRVFFPLKTSRADKSTAEDRTPAYLPTCKQLPRVLYSNNYSYQ